MVKITGKTRHVWQKSCLFWRESIRVFQVEKLCDDRVTNCGEFIVSKHWFNATPSDMEQLHALPSDTSD